MWSTTVSDDALCLYFTCTQTGWFSVVGSHLGDDPLSNKRTRCGLMLSTHTVALPAIRWTVCDSSLPYSFTSALEALVCSCCSRLSRLHQVPPLSDLGPVACHLLIIRACVLALSERSCILQPAGIPLPPLPLRPAPVQQPRHGEGQGLKAACQTSRSRQLGQPTQGAGKWPRPCLAPASAAASAPRCA
jgi:hypothetical protein